MLIVSDNYCQEKSPIKKTVLLNKYNDFNLSNSGSELE